MLFVTVSRQTGSLGKEITELLAQKLDLPIINRDLVMSQWFPEIANKHELHMLSESPGFFLTISQQNISFAEYLENRLRSFIATQPAIIFGLGAQIIFADHPAALHLKTLRSVDLIACEDTRQTIKLLNKYKIKKKMISYHEYSDPKREDYIVDLLLQGKKIALLSDAGMPGISDPGEKLLQKVLSQPVEIEIIPGPSAAISALAISGLDMGAFIFEGFLPRQAGKRKEMLKKNLEESRTLIYYETPHRLLKTLYELQELLDSNRKVVVVRELTKKHQEIIRGNIDEIVERFKEGEPRGEICLLIGGKVSETLPLEKDKLVEEIEELIQQGMDKKEAFKLKARQYKVKKSLIYKYYNIPD